MPTVQQEDLRDVEEEKSDFGAITTTLVKWARWGVHLTPAALWSAIVALAVAIGYVVNAQHDISQLKETVAESKRSVTDMQQKFELLQDIKTQLAVMNGKVTTIADEVDRQREWREHVENVAESPPHLRRRR